MPNRAIERAPLGHQPHDLGHRLTVLQQIHNFAATNDPDYLPRIRDYVMRGGGEGSVSSAGKWNASWAIAGVR